MLRCECWLSHELDSAHHLLLIRTKYRQLRAQEVSARTHDHRGLFAIKFCSLISLFDAVLGHGYW